jgi:transcriptional regulator with XRE-family HTH domain
MPVIFLEDIYLSNIAKNIKRLRKEIDITQQELADKIHVSNSLVSHWEKGDREPKPQELIALAKFFGCTTDELFNDESFKANVSKTTQVIQVKDFKKDLKYRYLILKALYVLISIGVIVFFQNGNKNFSMIFFLVFVGIIVIDIFACFYNKSYVKTYNVDLDFEVKFVNRLEKKDIWKDWNFKIVYIFFSFIASIIVLPIIFLMIQNNSPDTALTIISVIVTLAIFSNYVALVIYEFKDNLKHEEIAYMDFNYRLRIFFRKTLLVIYEVVFVIIYTMLIYYGRKNIVINDSWVALFFPPALVVVSHLLYIMELDSLIAFKINIL